MQKTTFYKVMIRKKVLTALLLCITLASLAFGQSGGPYSIVFSTIDGGGGTSGGGPFTLIGTIGQHDAKSSSGGSYVILGGFLGGESLCFVDFDDFARFALYWRQSGTGLPADLYLDDNVNSNDLLDFANLWLCTCPENWPLK
jgi:hypothetical protein